MFAIPSTCYHSFQHHLTMVIKGCGYDGFVKKLPSVKKVPSLLKK
jgi:hypothetical protein